MTTNIEEMSVPEKIERQEVPDSYENYASYTLKKQVCPKCDGDAFKVMFGMYEEYLKCVGCGEVYWFDAG
jgi:uncharacterized protein with PIN domain